MSGGAGIKLPWAVREAVGVCPSPHGLTLVRLCAAGEDGDAWMVTESRTSEESCPVPSDAEALASFVHTHLIRAGWEKMPLALSLPASEAAIEERELPVRLEGTELRAALLWALCAEMDETNEENAVRICCMPLPDTGVHRYWVARMEEQRIQDYFSAFSALGLKLRRLTVCPPHGGVLAAQIEAAREPRMPWETTSDDEEPAIYAGLLMRTGMPENLYWTVQQNILEQLHAHAATLIAVLGTAFFLANVAADITSCMTAGTARDYAVEELALRASERARMQEFHALRANVAKYEQMLDAFAAESLPLRALLVHLGSMTVDGVRISEVQAEARDIRIDGEAVNYAALASFMGAMEDDDFFSAEVTLENAGKVQRAADTTERIHFILRSSW